MRRVECRSEKGDSPETETAEAFASAMDAANMIDDSTEEFVTENSTATATLDSPAAAAAVAVDSSLTDNAGVDAVSSSSDRSCQEASAAHRSHCRLRSRLHSSVGAD